MSKIKHTCSDEDRHLDLICHGCLKKIIAKKDKLLEFVKKCAYDYHDWENTNEMSFDATDILKEIGELND